MNASADRHVLCESPRAEQRLATATAFLRALPASSPALIIADSQAAAQWLVADALRGSTGARFAWHRRTLSSLAEELALPQLARERRVPLRGLGALALVTRVVEQEAQDGQLGRYTRIARQPGFARALLATLSDLRKAQLSAAELAAHDPELARLYAAYQRSLDDLSVADEALVLRAASEGARAGTRFAGAPLVLLDLEIASAAQSELVAALLASASAVCATFVRGDERSEAYLRTHLDSRVAVRRLEPLDERDLSRLQARLFASTMQPLHTPSQRGGVRIVSSPGESREAVEVVRSALAAAASGIPFDRMAIALRAGEVYRSVVEEALARAAIPAHFADGVRRPLPEGRALLWLVECAREGLSARAFGEYVSIGLMPFAEPEQRARRGRWERLLLSAQVGGGRERWLKRLSALRAELNERAHGADLEEERAREREELQAADELMQFVEPLLALLEELPRARTWGSYLERLEQIALHALAEPDGVVEVLRELLPLSDVSDVSLATVERVLSSRLSSVIVRSQGHGAGKVLVGTPSDLRGRSFHVVFTMGLSEQLFPPRLSEDPLLPDRLRRRLSPDLPVVEERAAEERLALRVCVGAAAQELVLSYPRFDFEHGRPRVPSFYGLEVLHAMDGTLPAFDELTRRAAQGAAARMGFPAPELAEQAIDDAEYDLALLGELLRRERTQRAGGLRYLLAQHAHLARALRFRARRWTLHRFSAADGFVASDDETRALLADHQLAVRAYAPSALAQVAACPYRFFLHAVMGLRERDRSYSLSELDARERGVLMHQIQQATLSALRAQSLLPVTSERFEMAAQVLAQVFERLASDEKDRRDPALARVLDESLSSLRHDLTEWLRAMGGPERVQWMPSHFELGFGVAPSAELDPSSVAEPVQLEGLKLKGVVDMVEQHSGRDERGRIKLRVTDHKSSVADESAKRVITKGGTLLQPLLYGLAVERLFPEAQVTEGLLYFCTTRADFHEQPVPLDGEARATFRELVQAIDSLLRAGFLPAAPNKDECGRCAYQAVCGPYEEKERVPVVKAKDFDRLAPLFRLRNLP